MSPSKSGFSVTGDAKSLVKLSGIDGNFVLVASQNQGSLKVFAKTSPQVELKTITPGQEVMAVILDLGNGKKQRIETSFGSGFLSLSSRKIMLPKGIKRIQLIDYKGQVKEFDLANLGN
jgi:hypothetical protein